MPRAYYCKLSCIPTAKQSRSSPPHHPAQNAPIPPQQPANIKYTHSHAPTRHP
ncbi:hypothetical protein FA15DRAFT_669406 [Coprinopsis marcescibilis]|uniref:Uncharacterized protein n=1 Tax=Coprinopsis marcescibilis TaxID=230819 RepID=A0A5C3KVU9_COPMA|nr:hypothetical protein FA15DRAFT_669406 [Coprinopsis marcescibilis]